MRKEFVEAIKANFPAGTRVKCIYMDDPRPIAEGTLGTVEDVDDMGTIHVLWDNGRHLGLVPDTDIYAKV